MSSPERALERKVIVIVGGTSGLGLSAAKACVRAGARLVVVGRDPEKLDEAAAELGREARVLSGDATDPTTAEAAISRAEEEWGGFDGLYHVAGGSGRRWGDGPLHELPPEAWDLTLELNLKSLALSSRAAIRHLIGRRRGGSILNMGSVLAYAPSPRLFATHAYAAAKAGAIGLTRAAAAYYAPHGIRINLLALGLTDTPMAKRTRQDERILSYVRTKQPLDGGRIGLPSDADGAAVFLLSDASRFITGQVLAVDGGWSVSEGIDLAADEDRDIYDAGGPAPSGGTP